MELLTVALSADARFGFGGGCHAHVLRNLRVMGTSPHDWLVVDSLLSRYTMWTQVRVPTGGTTCLPPIKPKGGGMVQGLSLSSRGHSRTALRAAFWQQQTGYHRMSYVLHTSQKTEPFGPQAKKTLKTQRSRDGTGEIPAPVQQWAPDSRVTTHKYSTSYRDAGPTCRGSSCLTGQPWWNPPDCQHR